MSTKQVLVVSLVAALASWNELPVDALETGQAKGPLTSSENNIVRVDEPRYFLDDTVQDGFGCWESLCDSSQGYWNVHLDESIPSENYLFMQELDGTVPLDGAHFHSKEIIITEPSDLVLSIRNRLSGSNSLMVVQFLESTTGNHHTLWVGIPIQKEWYTSDKNITVPSPGFPINTTGRLCLYTEKPRSGTHGIQINQVQLYERGAIERPNDSCRAPILQDPGYCTKTSTAEVSATTAEVSETSPTQTVTEEHTMSSNGEKTSERLESTTSTTIMVSFTTHAMLTNEKTTDFEFTTRTVETSLSSSSDTHRTLEISTNTPEFATSKTKTLESSSTVNAISSSSTDLTSKLTIGSSPSTFSTVSETSSSEAIPWETSETTSSPSLSSSTTNTKIPGSTSTDTASTLHINTETTSMETISAGTTPSIADASTETTKQLSTLSTDTAICSSATESSTLKVESSPYTDSAPSETTITLVSEEKTSSTTRPDVTSTGTVSPGIHETTVISTATDVTRPSEPLGSTSTSDNSQTSTGKTTGISNITSTKETTMKSTMGMTTDQMEISTTSSPTHSTESVTTLKPGFTITPQLILLLTMVSLLTFIVLLMIIIVCILVRRGKRRRSNSADTEEFPMEELQMSPQVPELEYTTKTLQVAYPERIFENQLEPRMLRIPSSTLASSISNGSTRAFFTNEKRLSYPVRDIPITRVSFEPEYSYYSAAEAKLRLRQSQTSPEVLLR